MLPKSRTLLLLAAFALGLSACATAKKKAGADLINEDDWVNPVQEYDEGNGLSLIHI